MKTADHFLRSEPSANCRIPARLGPSAAQQTVNFELRDSCVSRTQILRRGCELHGLEISPIKLSIGGTN